jgi:phosphatidylinositol-binding clathrin assembly protein
MSKTDAERALNIYRVFVKQTDQVVQYLGMARHYEHATRLEIPKIKHAPTSLAASLEEYLNDKDFEINRRQYLAQQEAKKGAKCWPNVSLGQGA